MCCFRGVIRTASYNTFTPANSAPFAYSQIFTYALLHYNLDINGSTLREMASTYWKISFRTYQAMVNSAQSQGTMDTMPFQTDPEIPTPPKPADSTSNEDTSTVGAATPQTPSPSIVTTSGSPQDPTVINDPPRNQKSSTSTESVDLDSAPRPTTPENQTEIGDDAKTTSSAQPSQTEMPPVSSSTLSESKAVAPAKPERAAKAKAIKDLTDLTGKRQTSSKRKRTSNHSEDTTVRPSKIPTLAATSSLSRNPPSTSPGELAKTTGEEHILSLLQHANSFSPLTNIPSPDLTSPEVQVNTLYTNLQLDDMMDHKIPNTYKEAIKNADSEMWIHAMHEEMSQMRLLDVWESVQMTPKSLPKGAKPINCRWVFALKPPQNREPARFKARLVALGNHQIQGIYYTDTYSEVIEISIVRYMLA